MFKNTFSISVGIDVRSLVEIAIVKNIIDHKNNTICNPTLSSPRHLRENYSRKTQLQNLRKKMDGDEFQNFKICILWEIFQVELVEVEEKAEGRESHFSDGNVWITKKTTS